MSFDCISPIDGSVLVSRPYLSLEAAREAVLQGTDEQRAWAALPLAERIARVMKGVEIIGEMNDAIVPDLARQMGRPVRYGGEFGGFRERAAYMAEIAEEALAPIEVEDSDAFRRYITREPHGLVLVIAPWNYPYMTAINAVAPALIAGNAVVLKHAAQTLLVGEHLAQAFHKAGIPEGVFQNLALDHDTVETLIAEKRFGFVNFTGSVGGGRAIERAAAGTFTGVGLELGGKDPGYVMADADLDAAVDTLIDGAMFNSGQCCCGIERIYVAAPLFDAFVEKAVAIVEGYKLGDPLDPETTLGPMAHERFAETVRAQVEDAIAKGATPLIDPALFPQAGAAYVGFVFFPKSPRNVSIETAAALAAEVPVGICKVALTVNADNELLDRITDTVPLDMLQLHGKETPERVAEVKARYGLPVMKAVGIATADDLPTLETYVPVADQILLDAKPSPDDDRPGGNGVAFDWTLIANRRWPVPWMLAGGLTPDNVAEAVRLTGARQVDLSSGIESAPGVKDPAKIAALAKALA